MRCAAFLRVGATLVLLCSASRLVQAQAAADAPQVHVDDTWKYRTVDGFTHETTLEYTQRVVEVNDHEIVVQLHNNGGVKGALRYFNREWNPVDVGNAKYDPYYPEFKFPMSAGMTWNAKFVSSTNDGVSYSGYATVSVPSLEKVTVAAGTFDAYRIERAVETRATNANAVMTTWQITTWYAPAARRFVRRESVATRDGRVRGRSIDELMEYNLGAKTKAAPPSVGDTPRATSIPPSTDDGSK
jgi:hypothetical protein